MTSPAFVPALAVLVGLGLLASCKSRGFGDADAGKPRHLAERHDVSNTALLLASDPPQGNMSTDLDLAAMKEVLEALPAPFRTIAAKNQTREKLLDSVSKAANLPAEYGTLLVYYSGHGRKEDGAFVTWTGRIDKPFDVDEAVPFADVLEAIHKARRNKPLRRLIVMVDACHSGHLATVNRRGQTVPWLLDSALATEGIALLSAQANQTSICTANKGGFWTYAFREAMRELGKDPEATVADLGTEMVGILSHLDEEQTGIVRVSQETLIGERLFLGKEGVRRLPKSESPSCGRFGDVRSRVADCAGRKQARVGSFELVTRTTSGRTVWLDTKSKMLWSDPGESLSEKIPDACQFAGDLLWQKGALPRSWARFRAPLPEELEDSLARGLDAVFPQLRTSPIWQGLATAQTLRTERPGNALDKGLLICVSPT